MVPKQGSNSVLNFSAYMDLTTENPASFKSGNSSANLEAAPNMVAPLVRKSSTNKILVDEEIFEAISNVSA